jgi:hypothetical protein
MVYQASVQDLVKPVTEGSLLIRSAEFISL